MDTKEWNYNLQKLRSLILKSDSFEDALFEGVTEDITRIEDITMNLLVDGRVQIFEKENWYDHLNVLFKGCFVAVFSLPTFLSLHTECEYSITQRYTTLHLLLY